MNHLSGGTILGAFGSSKYWGDMICTPYALNTSWMFACSVLSTCARGRGSALWRVELADWARGVLAPAAALPPDTALPPLTDTPLLALATRLALGDATVRVVDAP